MKKIKLTETTGGSFKCVLPKDLVNELGWEKGDLISVKKRGNKMVLEVENESF